jgi:hypothetical protein
MDSREMWQPTEIQVTTRPIAEGPVYSDRFAFSIDEVTVWLECRF